MAEYDSIEHFARVAPQRLQDAEELLQFPTLPVRNKPERERHLRGAVYMPGYCVECVLKQYIISREPSTSTLEEALQRRRDRGEAVPDLLGAAGHDLNLLFRMTDLAGSLDKDQNIKVDWGICNKWKSTWRYDPSVPKEAHQFVRSVRIIYEWVKRRL